MKSIFAFLFCFIFSLSLFAQSPKNLSLVSHVTFQNTGLSDVWAYVDSSGHEYALVGRHDGLSIFDLADPANPAELHFIPGRSSIWRDMITYRHVAYTSNEGGDGLLIVDLSGLPANVSYKDTIMQGVETAHNVWVDEFGFLYVVGIDNENGDLPKNGGMVMYDLKPNPLQPRFVGEYTERYIHDVYVRNNLAYAGEIYDGLLTIIDVSDKANPQVLGSRNYQDAFTHNTWLNDSGTVCFTTDELDEAYLYAWDVTDPTDIVELDKIRSSLGGGRATPHNVHVFNDFLITSYYKDGIHLVDASRPHNLVEVGHYDTNPLEGGGTDGCWGAYPYLPSGYLLATDIEEGFYIFQPTYQRACYLEGKVTDATTGQSLVNTVLQAQQPELEDLTNNQGEYAVGISDAGTYELKYLKYGYLPLTRTVALNNGQVTLENVQLQPAPQVGFTYNVIDAQTGQPIADAEIRTEAPAGAATFSLRSDGSGQAQDANLLAGQYSVIIGKWGYQSREVTIEVDANNNSLTVELETGYYDDFALDFGWIVGGNAQSGIWEKGEPVGTDMYGNTANPDRDLPGDLGDEAFVTGNGGGQFFQDEVNDGTTTLTSPGMDLRAFQDPVLSYHWWLLNFDAFRLQDGDDTLRVWVFNGPNQVEVAKYGRAWAAQWNEQQPIHLLDYFSSLGSSVRVQFVISDEGRENILEAAIDGFVVEEFQTTKLQPQLKPQVNLAVFPQPATDHFKLRYELPQQLSGGELRLSIFDLQGRKIHSQPLPWQADDLRVEFPYPKGVYLLSLTHNGELISSRKLVK
jgi:choice-of-anchor B domain-containing protein